MSRLQEGERENPEDPGAEEQQDQSDDREDERRAHVHQLDAEPSKQTMDAINSGSPHVLSVDLSEIA